MSSAASPATLEQRQSALYDEYLDRTHAQTSRIFMVLMIAEWIFAVVLALTVTPTAWAGKVESVNPHVWTALILGGIVSSLPVFLALTQPASMLTRSVMAVAQML